MAKFTGNKIKYLTYLLKITTKYPVHLFFGFFAILLVVKYLLITNLNNDEFLLTYKFVSSDSYDWIANGIRLFDNDSISFRNPGLPLIIKGLNNLKALFLLPLLNQIVYLFTSFYLYKICRQYSTNLIAFLIPFVYLMNFTFNIGANIILADFYAVFAITASVYFILVKKYWLAFFALFISLLFQNLAILLIPLWIGIVVLDGNRDFKNILKRKNFGKIVRIAFLFVLSGLPFIFWAIYKYDKFGNPFYDSVGHLGLLNPNLDSVFFYSLNSVVLFSPIIIPFGLYLLRKPREFFRNKTQLFFLVGLAINTVFWVVLYDWNDRRFLVYFIPWLYPLIAWYLGEIKLIYNYKIAIILLIFYPTILPTSSFFTADEIPIIHNIYLKREDVNGMALSKKTRPDFSNPLMNANPTMYHALVASKYYRFSNSTWYSFYSSYIDSHFNESENSICLDKEQNIRNYPVSTILQIKKNIDMKKVKIYVCP